MTDLTKIEARIVELCERAKAKGWRFVALADGDGKTCGCPLQACAHELGWPSWEDAGRALGLKIPGNFGYAFDLAVSGSSSAMDRANISECRLGARIAHRFVEGVG